MLRSDHDAHSWPHVVTMAFPARQSRLIAVEDWCEEHTSAAWTSVGAGWAIRQPSTVIIVVKFWFMSPIDASHAALRFADYVYSGVIYH